MDATNLRLVKFVFYSNINSQPNLSKDDGRANPASLTLSSNRDETFAEIAKFSERDAHKYFDFDHKLEHFSKAIDVLLDASPPNLNRGKLFHQREELYKIQKSNNKFTNGF